MISLAWGSENKERRLHHIYRNTMAESCDSLASMKAAAAPRKSQSRYNWNWRRLLTLCTCVTFMSAGGKQTSFTSFSKLFFKEHKGIRSNWIEMLEITCCRCDSVPFWGAKAFWITEDSFMVRERGQWWWLDEKRESVGSVRWGGGVALNLTLWFPFLFFLAAFFFFFLLLISIYIHSHEW